MRQWLCRCPEPTNLHTEAQAACDACQTLRPPELDPMPDDQAQRFAGLVDWLDGQLAKRPAVLATAAGLGLSALITQARNDPAGTYRTIAAAEPAISAIVGWVADAKPAGPHAFDLLGPEG